MVGAMGMTCPHCGREFRTKAARDRAAAYHDIHQALRREISLDALPSKQERHRGASETFRQTGAHVWVPNVSQTIFASVDG